MAVFRAVEERIGHSSLGDPSWQRFLGGKQFDVSRVSAGYLNWKSILKLYSQGI